MTTTTSDSEPVAPGPFHAKDLEHSTSAFRCISEAHHGQSGSSLEWNNLTFKIGDKTILKDCTGLLKPGELTAVLGPSGSGKSTLMNVLGGRQRAKGNGKSFEGAVSFSGQVDEPVRFRSRIAYVMQDDSLIATSTPREILEFSARLRLGAKQNMSKDEVKCLVQDLIESLRLTSCSETLVGNELIKGISGGERKRTSVGVELITKPDMIFLDEPLSGLDSYAAFTTVTVLKELAESGVPVMITVHQPSSEIYQLFDNVMILSAGEMVYYGKTSKVTEFFDVHGGLRCPSNFNPADFVLFVLQTEPQEIIQKLVSAYKKNAEENIVPAINSIRQTHKQLAIDTTGPGRASMMVQFRELLFREIQGTMRNPVVLIMRYMILLVLGLTFALIFFDVGETRDQDYWLGNAAVFQSYFGAIVALNIMAMMGSAQTAVLAYPAQRGIFLREYASNMYSAVPYVASKTLVELPLSFADSLFLMIITYWLMNLQGNFILWVLTLWLVNLCASSLAQVLGASCNSAAQAIQVLPLLTVPQILFGGIFTPIENIPVWLRWLQYVCFLKYGVNIAYLIEFGDDFDVINDQQNIDPDLIGLYLGVTFGLLVVMRVTSIIILKKKAKFVF
ncbi:ATP-binding cassette transporter, putative [Perkinsus marinus ATCC 50983]|uniref:ATP-binding cassette transporter, putative n=1 Tax=Perkinsus marinus (strain ATCC 50983 / TXsc) TaxID=423536 RepID=C5M036_PERM5|nr:ATP-binding cassette transporter, putative [Perkinsus marinus ATCC 50983]EEQ97614.1 ATP-binding cassette transporter, putative [Perkinsus marinus ATCC 50983]|eukprot:XP_002764897.1 ATP-binding cassette transporter, putative [Perkinsus marinus ATCC 50983]